MVEEAKALFGVSLTKALISFTKAPPSGPGYVPEALPPNALSLEAGIQWISLPETQCRPLRKLVVTEGQVIFRVLLYTFSQRKS